MKVMRKLLLVLLLTVLLTGCGVCSSDGAHLNSAIKEPINLNVLQADLIASITDNEKYLNKDLLYSVEGLADDDKINVIVTIDEQSIVGNFNDNNRGYSTLSEYAGSRYVSSTVKEMNNVQQKFANELLNKNYINEINHSYTTVINGFSASTTYGQFKKLVKAGYDVKLTISEVYSEPEVNVLNSYDSSSEGYDMVTNYVNVYETGIFNSSGVGYDGGNTAVAILDSGFDIHHTVFQNMPNQPMISMSEVQDVLYETKAYGYKQDIKVQDVYMNSKIPFAYDYADKDADVAPFDSNHGTHVAGIIGGKDDVITGVAVNTQLVLMKVFGDINNGALQDDILAALEDAILLGVDAINLSLGSACGFSRSSDNEYINVVYDQIEAAGISLVVAASNDYSSGYGGENSNTNKASNPDSATVGSPGTYGSTIAVASISGVKSKYIISEDGYTFFFNNANNSAGEAYDFYEMLYESLGTKEQKIEIEYVTVPGVGKKVNYSSIDVKGKIALVKRGDTSFEEKAQVALSEGAIGCIIYNNIAGEVYMNAGSHLEIALCSISKDDGEYLAAKGSGKLVLDTSYLAGPFMSDFSSWGPVSDLSLKPEITAHGGSILSSVPGGGYDEISGTSMACPNLCGVIILVKQALKDRYPGLTAQEYTNMTNSLLMSTSTIILNEEGNPYSPRKQGSGLGNLQYALDTMAYLSVDDQTKPKLELKDDPEETGIYELVFNVHNISTKELKYRLTNQTMTESLSTADPEYVAEKSYMLNPKTASSIEGNGTLVDDIVTVEAGGTVKIKYTLTLTEKELEYIQRSFINGIYIEGFAVLESLNEDGIDLSIPFLAFYGDWTKAPMFDKTYYEVESEAHNGAIDEEDKLKADYYATTPLGTYYYSYIIPLGSYVYEIDESKYDPVPASEEHAAIGYNINTINGITTVYAGLLRNAKKMTSVITNANTGEVVWEHVKYDEHKAYFSGTVVPGYDIINITAADLGLQNNTKYTFTMTAELDYGDGGFANNANNSFEFSFYVDYQAPIVTDAQFYSKYDKTLKDYRYYVDVYVYDNHYAQSIRPFTIVDGTLVSLVDKVIPIYGEKDTINKVTVEITDYMDLLQYGRVEYENDETGEKTKYSLTNGLGFLVDDYALNQSYSYVALPGTDSMNITYKEEYATLASGSTYQYNKRIYVGDILDLASMLTSDDAQLDQDETVQTNYFRTLEWRSSNEDILATKDGYVEAKGKGTAIITCATMKADGYVYETKIKIDVRDKDVEQSEQKVTDIKLTYFDTIKAFIDGPEVSEIGKTGDRFFFTEKPIISCYPSEQVKIGFDVEPWNLTEYETIWESTNDKIATVDEEGLVTALKEGTATISLKIKVGDTTTTLMDSVRVVVKNEFVIEGNVLTAYKGLGGDVVIPDDEGILYIGAFAFSLYTTDYEIKIEEDDYDAAKTPESNNTVTSITIPADVLEVRKYAFYNCTELETVTFLKDSEGESCPYIREYAFYNDKKLKNINLEEIELIGKSAFEKCEGLENVNLTKLYAVGEQAFKDCINLEYVDITNLRNAAPEVFLNCKNLKTIDNGIFTKFSNGMFKNSGLTSLTYNADRIPDNCFENCDSLTNVVISRTIVYVGKNAFRNSDNLKTVEFVNGAGTEFIYEGAFSNCKTLEKVILPDSQFEIEQNIFSNCNNLSTVEFNQNSNITSNLGQVFKGCTNLQTFVVNDNNTTYKTNNNLLLSKDGKSLILAAPGYNYGTYIIPSEIEVIKEGAFSSIISLEKLDLANVLVIEASAFKDCSNLKEVTSTNIETIKEYAFEDCVNLETINFLNNLNEIAAYSFANTALKEIVINNNNLVIQEGAFSNNKNITSVNLNVKEIKDSAFENNTGLISLEITTKEIGDSAFRNCTSLTNVILNNVEKVGNYAFIGCNQVESIESETIRYIGSYAFADMKKLSNITLNNVVEIGSYAFSTTTNESGNSLSNVVFGNTLEKVGEYAFYLSGNLVNVELGSGIKEIGSYAFSSCSSLESFKTLANIETIEEATFLESASLQIVDIPGIKYVKDAAFYECLALSTINLNNVIEIGMQAFNNCQELVSLSLPNVTKIDAGAFLQASKLESISMPKIEYIGAQALSCINVTEIALANTISYIAPTAFYYNLNQVTFTDIFGNDTVKVNDYITLDEGVLYLTTENNKYLLSAYPTAKTSTEYSVLFNTVRIEEYAGYFNKYLEKLIFPDTLKLIGNMCFYGCTKLKTIEFKSTIAPTLEGTVSELNLEYTQDSEIYQFLNKYFQFNGYYPLYYGQFVDMIGKAKKLNIIIPANEDVSGYDGTLYNLYFDLKNITTSEYIALNQTSIDYLNKVALVPTNVELSDVKIIQDARTAYNVLNQDLTEYGYSSDYLDSLYQNLVNAEAAWKKLNDERINKVYKHLIADINALGPNYDFDKISDYYKVVEALEIVNRDDKNYIDQTNVEEFKKQFDEYFKNLNEDVNVMTDITTLPTTTVNKVGLIVGISASISLGGLLFVLIKKRFF